jgi:hypothetical protein
MLNWNELKYIATKQAASPNLPVMENFDPNQPMPSGLELLGQFGNPEAQELNNYIREQLSRTDPAQGYDTDPVHGRSDVGKNINRAQEYGVPTEPGFMDKLKDYMPSVGMGAGAGALAGIPVALLVNALTGDSKKKGLRSYLKASLLGALVGGGVGAGGGALYRALTGLNIGEPRMSETPLGLHNRMYAPTLDHMRTLGLSSMPRDPKAGLTDYLRGLSEEEIKAMNAESGGVIEQERRRGSRKSK